MPLKNKQTKKPLFYYMISKANILLFVHCQKLRCCKPFYILLILSNQNKGKDKTVKIKEIEKPERMKLTAGSLKSSKRDKPDWLGKREETNFYVTVQLSF